MRNIHFESVFTTDQATTEQLSIPLNKFPCYEATKSKRKRKRLWFPEEGPFICTECQENFESSDTLKSHWDKVCNLKTKSTVEKLCNLCGKTFQRNSHLKKHVRSIHEKIPYDCTGEVNNLGRDTFGNPIFQTVLQNQPSSRIISILGCFVYTLLTDEIIKWQKCAPNLLFFNEKKSERFG